ncbi:MAG: DUF4166 domain-containing protein [Candidatus Latescibacteria bacterium]|nr:DUF4166 domain-containing protein [Candidatus Latescibacterota bacterium]
MRQTAMGLYRQLLGDSWENMHQAIRALHDLGGPSTAAGAFQVRRGTNPWAWGLAQIMGLPEVGDAVPVRLAVETEGRVQIWRRDFAGCTLVSRQFEANNGLLVERFGRLEIHLRLHCRAGALHYQTVGAVLCLGPVRLPLVGFMRPRIEAWEKPLDGGPRIEISVHIAVPLLGRLLAYNGQLTQVEDL